MSLLMDALKKAEQEKKKALEDSGASPRDALEQRMAVLQTEDATALADSVRTPTEPLEEPGNLTAPAELTLEPLPPVEGHRADKAEKVTTTDPQDLLEQFKAELADMTLDLSQSATLATDARPLPDYDKEATLPSERAIKSSLKDYFEASQSLSLERSKAGIPPSPAGQEILSTGAHTTRVSAQTVFTAGHKTSPWKTGYTLASLTVLAVVPLLFYLMYVELKTPLSSTLTLAENRPLPPAIENQPEALAPSPEAATAPSSEEPPLQASESEKFASTTPETDVAVAPLPTTPAPGPISKPEEKAAVAQRPPTIALGEKRIEAAGPQSTSKARMFDDYSEEAPFASSMQMEPSAIKITKSRSRDAIHPRVTEAYNAYKAGQYAKAKTLYQAALAQHRDNRDALLGLAAIAMQEGNREQSSQYYQQLLQINPKDSVAASGLFSLQKNGGREAQESQLKLLLDQGQRSVHTYFSLGNLYARQSRWAEAQEAYFQAYTGNDRNSDYTFNLAVSLDHLGRNKAALTYYRQALSLADRQPAVNFNTAQILSRIQVLSSLADSN